LVLGPPNGPATSTFALAYAVYTVVATNTIVPCQSTQTILINQNFRLPVSSPTIIGLPSAICNNNTVTLTPGNSTVTSGGPGALVNIASWQGPPPQVTGTTSIYNAMVPGAYTLTIKDSYNGCTRAGVLIVPSNSPYFMLNSVSPTTSVSCDGIITITNTPPNGYSVSTSSGILTGTPQKTIANLCTGKVVVCLTYTSFNVGCKACDSLILGVSTGLNNHTLDDKFVIYPNPTNSVFYIKNLQQKTGALKLYNVEGKEIENQYLDSETETKIEKLNAGLYFIEIRIGTEVLRKKIVVIK
jgi:hypothetical protein